MSLILNFISLQFSKPYRYFLLVNVNGIAKRTKISQLSDLPQFDSITIDSGDIEISVCLVLDYSQKGLEGRTVVLGKTLIQQKEYINTIISQGGIQIQKKITQAKDNKEIVVGIVRLKILNSLKIKKESNKYFQNIQQIELKDQQTPNHIVNYSSKGKRIKYSILYGTHFSPTQSYKVQIGYSSSYNSMSLTRSSQTQYSKYSINPVWNYHNSFSIQNLEGGFVTLIIKNNLETIIDKVSIPISKMILFYQYHLEVVLKQFISDAYPHILVSIQLQALPLAFIEQVCELHVNKVHINPQPLPMRKFFLIFSQQQLPQIQFQPLELNKNRPMQLQIIQNINKQHHIPYFMSPIFTSPFSISQSNFQYFFLKSSFIRKRVICTLYEFKNNTYNFKYVSKLSDNKECINDFKSCYYNEQSQMFSLNWKQSSQSFKCTLQIIPSKVNLYGDKQAQYKKTEQNQITQEWKGLSHQLQLKQKLIHQMRQDIDFKINNIQKKGKKIQSLRKAEHNLLQRKKYLNYKQSKQRMIQIADYEIEGKINIEKLKHQLISLCEQTQAVENINNEMRLRLQTLDLQSKQTNIKELEMRAVNNSRILLEQQQKVQNIERLDDLIKIQHKTLLKLEKQFQKGIIDYQMNQLLNKEIKKVQQSQSKLKDTFSGNRTTEQDNLQKILSLLTNNNKKQKKPYGHIQYLKRQIQQAEEELKRKTLIFTEMINK